ncbi:MAG: hypothetical protein IJK99_09540 [Bacteroidales bacterium]|nr:hypothetical protein [Bacteroidales bacterium]
MISEERLQHIIESMAERGLVEGKEVVIVCKPKAENIARVVANKAGLVIVRIDHEDNENLLDENRVVYIKADAVPTYKLPTPEELDRVFEKMDYTPSIDLDAMRNYQRDLRQQHKYAIRQSSKFKK